MKLTPQQREKLAWIILSLVALIISITLGVSYPLPMQRAPQAEPTGTSPDEGVVELGTTHFSGLAVSGPVTFSTGNYPLEFASDAYQAVYGTTDVTGTGTASHGLTTVTFALCTLDEDPTSGAGDGAMCTAAVSANVVTLKVWQDDFITAATESDVAVHWIAIGVE